MGFLDRFVEIKKDDEPVAPQIKANVPQSTVPPLPLFNQSAPVVTSTPTGSLSNDDLQKFNAHFDDLFEKANLPGPDYFEFSKMSQAMATLTDDIKLPAVFGGLQVQGLTKAKLVESANHYVQIIDEDAKKFSNAIDGQLMADAQNKRQQSEAKRASIVQKQEMIRQLQADIAAEQMAADTLSQEANDIERKATEKSTIYKMACDARKSQIANDVQKINLYIK